MAFKKVWIPVWEDTPDSFTRVSGLPVGLPDNEWPICQLCSTPLSFIAQIEQSEILEKDNSVLFIFVCRNFDSTKSCEEFVGTLRNCRGTHRIIKREPIARKFTTAPNNLPPAEDGLGLVSWRIDKEECADGIEDYLVKGFNESTRSSWPKGTDWSQYVDMSMHFFRQSKIGGFPVWIQEPWFNENMNEEWEYIAQFTDINSIGGEALWSTLESGILFLLKNNKEEYELYYQGR